LRSVFQFVRLQQRKSIEQFKLLFQNGDYLENFPGRAKGEAYMAEEPKKSVDFQVDRGNLYHEESFTDLKAGTIKRLTPVRPDGSADKSRKTIFVGHTNILTPQGPFPIQGVIQAKELQQAIKKFPEAMEAAMNRLVEEVKKYQEREDSRIQKPESRIIVPGR
jgi:hypothetical protein